MKPNRCTEIMDLVYKHTPFVFLSTESLATLQIFASQLRPDILENVALLDIVSLERWHYGGRHLQLVPLYNDILAWMTADLDVMREILPKMRGLKRLRVSLFIYPVGLRGPDVQLDSKSIMEAWEKVVKSLAKNVSLDIEVQTHLDVQPRRLFYGPMARHLAGLNS